MSGSDLNCWTGWDSPTQSTPLKDFLEMTKRHREHSRPATDEDLRKILDEAESRGEEHYGALIRALIFGEG